MNTAIITAIRPGYYVYERSFHEKLVPSHLKNGGVSTVPIRFEKKAAMEISKILNISMALNGRFVGALEMRGDDIIVSEDIEKYTEDDMVAVDFEYFAIMTIDDE
jgi:hypothetical protein